MNTGTITAVGIDVSKHKSTVAARRPGGEVVLLPFDVEHTAEGLKKLITKLRQLDGEIRIIMEHTGMYWRPIAMTLKEAGFYVSVVNAILIHNFSDNSIRKVQNRPCGRDENCELRSYLLDRLTGIRWRGREPSAVKNPEPTL